MLWCIVLHEAMPIWELFFQKRQQVRLKKINKIVQAGLTQNIVINYQF